MTSCDQQPIGAADAAVLHDTDNPELENDPVGDDRPRDGHDPGLHDAHDAGQHDALRQCRRQTVTSSQSADPTGQLKFTKSR